jgi:hypothetical protein
LCLLSLRLGVLLGGALCAPAGPRLKRTLATGTFRAA